MGAPYDEVDVNDYNLNPPADDGSQTESNKITWAGIKSKLADPLKTAIEAVNDAVASAFAKLIGGAGIRTVSTSDTVVEGDQGKLLRVTGSGATLTLPDATSVGTPFVFSVINRSGGDITLDGHSTQTIDGQTTATIPDGKGVTLYSDGANFHTDGQNWQFRFKVPGGRLTLTSGVPVLSSNTTGQTTVYYTPYNGNTIDLWDGSKFFQVTFAQVSQALSDNTKSPAASQASKVYWKLAWLDGSTFRVTRSIAWTDFNDPGEGTGTAEVEYVHGVLMNKHAIANGPAANRGIVVGIIATDGANQLNMMFTPSAASGGSANRLDVWNMFNRRTACSIERDSRNSWDYTTKTWRPYNGGSGNINNSITCVGMIEDAADIVFTGIYSNTNANVAGRVGIGINSTSVNSGSPGKVFPGSNPTPGHAHFRGFLGLGRNTITALEASDASGTGTFYGDNNDPNFEQASLQLHWQC